MGAPSFPSLGSFNSSNKPDTGKLANMTSERTGKPLPSNRNTVSNSITAVGKSAPAAQANADNFAKLFDDASKMSSLLAKKQANNEEVPPQDVQRYHEVVNTAKNAFVESPYMGIHSLVAKIMVESGFQPWNTISDQHPNEQGKMPAEAFNDFIDQIEKFGYDPDDEFGLKMLFSFVESEVRVVNHTETDFSDLIAAVSGMVNDSLDLALDIGEAIATDGTSAGLKAGESGVTGDEDPDVETAKKLVSSIANVANVASQKDHEDETCSLCHIGVIKYDEDNPDTPLLWTSYYSYLHLVKDEHCGKKSSSEELIIAYIQFSFNVDGWRAQVQNEIDKLGTREASLPMAPTTALTGTQTQGNLRNAVTTQGWNNTVDSRIEH